MKKSTEQINSDLVKSFIDFGEKMHEIIFKKPIKGEHLSILEFKLLCVLEKKGGSKMKDITEELEIASSSATDLTDKLIKEKLVERYRDPGDRRVVRVKLTEKGQSYLNEAKELKKKFWKSFVENIPEDERSEILEFFPKLYKIVCKMAEKGIYY